MAFFKIFLQGEERAVCQEDTIQDAEEGILVVLGPGEYEIKEISEEEAERWADEWANNLPPDDICPICEGPRARTPRGEIMLRVCKFCDFES